jgi:hypothetical protein
LELLERHGFIRLVGYRDEGGAERLYRATAASFQVDRTLFGQHGASLNQARAELLEAAAQDLRAAAPAQAEDAFVQRGFVQLTAAEAHALRAELQEVMNRYADRHTGGDEIEFVVGLFAAAR